MTSVPPSGDDGTFASFWHGGPLHAFAWACLASFPEEGARLSLYSYDPQLEVPPGVRPADARDICADETLVSRYLADGKPSIAAFADMFRYRMIRETGLCWVDADLVCLKKPGFAKDAYIYCRQADAVSTLLVNNAVLKLPPADPALAELVATAEAAAGVDGRWGALGPFLLTPILEKHGLYAKAFDPRVCYPIEPEQFWKPFLPSYRDEVARAASGATLMHLWSEAIRWSGYDFAACPPEGSYLWERFRKVGALARFARLSDEDEVRRAMGAQIAEYERRTADGAAASRSGNIPLRQAR
jgi:hypothetical protein